MLEVDEWNFTKKFQSFDHACVIAVGTAGPIRRNNLHACKVVAAGEVTSRAEMTLPHPVMT